MYYQIGEEHKEFCAEKTQDEDGAMVITQNPTLAPAVQKSKYEPKAQEADVSVSSDTVKDATAFLETFFKLYPIATEKELAYYVKDGVLAPVSGDYVFSKLVNPVFTKDGDNLKVSVSVSIYYFFKNKEDIFQSLVMELLRQCTDLIAAHFRQESPAFRYAALCLIEFEAVAMNQLVRETYYEGYTTPLTFEKITDHLADMTGRIFGDSLGLSKEDIFLRSLLIKGAMRGYIVQFDFSQPMDSQKYAALVLDTALQLLGISAAESHDVLAQLEQRLPEIEAIADEMIHRR